MIGGQPRAKAIKKLNKVFELTTIACTAHVATLPHNRSRRTEIMSTIRKCIINSQHEEKVAPHHRHFDDDAQRCRSLPERPLRPDPAGWIRRKKRLQMRDSSAQTAARQLLWPFVSALLCPTAAETPCELSRVTLFPSRDTDVCPSFAGPSAHRPGQPWMAVLASRLVALVSCPSRPAASGGSGRRLSARCASWLHP